MHKIEVVTLDDYQRLAGVTANKDMLHQVLENCGFNEAWIKMVGDMQGAAELQNLLDIAVLALGVAGEAGEVADYVKKHVGHSHPMDKNKMLKELGDVLWYVAVLANKLGFTLSEVGQANIDKLAARYPDGFNVALSQNRKVGDE